jgi:hypothetical protein
MLCSLNYFWIVILEPSLNKTFIHRWNWEVTGCNSWRLGSLVLAMLHSPHASPNTYPTPFEWHTDMILCHICHLISPSFPSGHITTSQERYTLHMSFTQKLFSHTTLRTWISITVVFIKFQVWVQDSNGNTTVKICDDSGEDPHCCRFEGSYLHRSSNVVSL